MDKENLSCVCNGCSAKCELPKMCIECGNQIIMECASKCGVPKLCVKCGEIVLITCDELNKKKLKEKYHQHSKLPLTKKCACPGTRRFYFLSDVYQPCTPWSTYEECDCGQ
ncbi:uncharacterized protein LOC123293503 [Chrysoperla carnea]|uniref:uncharacterized protein LOC123293503 n=1 Tax=Chrysoperla carnea TaxID=189513 RepID=UPI001D0741D7|nr:uncharacterized protein LOC123293503 [Chrysoperla carnea]